MKDDDSRGSSTATTVAIAVVLVLVLLPCLAVVGLFGLRFLWVGRAPAAPAPPPIVQPELKARSAPPPGAAPAESRAADEKQQ
jgi:hypothetical protein